MAAVIDSEHLGELDRRSIASSLQAHDFLRRGSPHLRAVRGHREWLHFFVAADGLELFINLSVFDDLRPAASHAERARVLVFARSEGRWDGAVEEVSADEVVVRGGQLTARFGAVTLDLEDGIIRLRGHLRERPIEFDLAFEARSFPSLATDVRIGMGATINWLVVPHLLATGSVTVAGIAHDVSRAPAYHDHNWGMFGHRDFRWQWGHAQSSSGHAVVFARLLDGIAGTAYLQSLFVWTGPRIARIFRGAEITVTPVGFLRRRSFTLPRFGSLLAVGATEVPERLLIEARSGDDQLSGELAFEDAACLILGDDRELDTTLLYEVLGRIRLTGQLSDQPIEIDAPVVFETMRKA